MLPYLPAAIPKDVTPIRPQISLSASGGISGPAATLAVGESESSRSSLRIERLQGTLDSASSTSASFRGQQLGFEGAAVLANAVKGNSSKFTQLDLSGNNFGPEGIQLLADAILTNTTLTRLDLGSNALGATGASAVAAFIRSNKTLRWLSLADNEIGNDGVAVIANDLPKNTVLHT
jgi:Ran GTPase-activating protein (RanGAP) involved in mRNA processing and transport